MKPFKVEFIASDANSPQRKYYSIILSWLSWLLIFTCVLFALLLLFLKLLPVLAAMQQSDISYTGDSDATITDNLHASTSWNLNNNKKVLILAQARSGSSFLGEIFNQHPDVMYLYEPLHAYKIFSMTGILSAGSYGVNALQVLFDLFNCNFSSLQDYLTFISFPELSSPHFRIASKTLSSPPFCKARATQAIYDALGPRRYQEFCPQLHFKKVTTACKTKRYTVVKDLVHRMPLQNAANLERLLSLQSDLHLVYLVRDPRAVVMSMKKMEWVGDGHESKFSSVSTAARYLCKQTLDILWGIDRWSISFGTRVHLIRYEDLASDSVHKSEELFTSLGITFPDDVQNWVRVNTNSYQSTLKIDPYRVHHRNASVSLHAWKTIIKNEELKTIQHHCADVMSILRYNSFDDVANLQDPVLRSFRTFTY